MKIYLVTDGDYSDYRVVAAYSTREKAEAAAAFFVCRNDIEEFELDTELPESPKGLKGFCVTMSLTGDSCFVHSASKIDVVLYPKEGGYYQPTKRSFYVWAEDSNHAINIVNERRIALIASGDWKE